jgi:hypothetical protein
MAWRITTYTYSEEPRVYRPPQRRGPGPFRRLRWAILGLVAGCAVMWFLVRGGPADWRQYPAVLKHAARGVMGEGSPEAPPEEFTERGADGELAYLEEVDDGIYPVAHGSSVYAAPDTRSAVVDHIHVGKHVRVTGSTPDFLRIGDETSTPGYIPFSAARVMNPEQEASLCYSIEIESKLLKYPNAHSEVVGDVGLGTDIPALGMGLHHYPYVRNASGTEGYVAFDKVVGHGRCPDY